MKYLLLTLILLIGSIDLLAQTEEKPWVFGLGYNTVDYQTEGSHAYNINLTSLRFSAGRYLWGNFSAEFAVALNEIDSFGGDPDMDLNHTAVDLLVFYSFGRFLYLVGKDPFDPYIGVGAGRTKLKGSGRNIKSNILSVVVGLNYWVNPRFSIYSQASYKDSTDIFADTYHEIVLGVRYTVDLDKL